MAKKGRGAAGCVLLLLGSFALMCGGSIVLAVVLFLFGPSMLWSWFSEDQPLAVAPVDRSPEAVAAIDQRVSDALASPERRVVLTGPELTAWLMPTVEAELPVFRLDVDAKDRAVLDLSFQPDPAVQEYVNVHMVGAFELDGGWATSATIDELVVGPMDLGPYLAGQDLTGDVNQNLAKQRAQEPEFDAALKQVDRLSIEGGTFVLVVTADDATAEGGKMAAP